MEKSKACIDVLEHFNKKLERKVIRVVGENRCKQCGKPNLKNNYCQVLFFCSKDCRKKFRKNKFNA